LVNIHTLPQGAGKVSRDVMIANHYYVHIVIVTEDVIFVEIAPEVIVSLSDL
jgi:hypothetical protein